MPFPIDTLLINGYVVDNPNLSDTQREALDGRLSEPFSKLVKEPIERAGRMVTIWRYIGVRPIV